MTTQTLTLVSFLRARYDEVADAYAVAPDPIGHAEVMRANACRRTVSVCEAMRLITTLHPAMQANASDDDRCSICLTPAPRAEQGNEWPCSRLRLLAQPFVDHPEFQPSGGRDGLI